MSPLASVLPFVGGVDLCYTEVKGNSVRYFQAGAGPAVVLVHGIGMTADTWIKNIGPLAASNRVIAVDLLGCGFSSGLTRAGVPPLEDWVNFLKIFLDHLEIADATLVGSSMGGWVAALSVLDDPARFNRLVLVCCEVLLTGTSSQIREIAVGSMKNGYLALSDLTLEGTRRRIRNLVIEPSSIPEAVIYAQWIASTLPNSREAFERRLQGLCDLPDDFKLLVGDRLGDICVPVLAVFGDSDVRGDRRASDRLIEQLPMCQAARFVQTGHLAQLERPQEFNVVVAEFLESNPPSSTGR